MATVKFLKGTLQAYNALATKDPDTYYYTTDTDNKVRLFLGSTKLANFEDIEALDTNDIVTASLNSSTNEITLANSIKQTDGLVSKTGTDITLAAVAKTGNAEDVSYDNTTSELPGSITNVQDAIEAVAAASAGGVSSKTIYIDDTSSTSGTDFAKIYKIYQGDTGSQQSPEDSELIGTINIPKDQFVDSAGLVDIAFNSEDSKLYDGAVDVTSLIVGSGTATSADAGKYIKLVFAITSGTAAKSTVYIKVNSLVDVYTGGTTAEVTVSVDANNVITATVGTIDGSKVTYLPNETVKAALTRLDDSDTTPGSVSKKIKDALSDLTTTKTAGGTTQYNGTFVITQIVETNGLISSITSTEVEAAGAAATAQTAAQSYADSAVEAALTWGDINPSQGS